MTSMSDALSTFIRFIQHEFLPKRTEKEDVCRISRLGTARGGVPSFARIQQTMSTRPQPKALAVESVKPKCPCSGKPMGLGRIIPRLPGWLRASGGPPIGKRSASASASVIEIRNRVR